MAKSPSVNLLERDASAYATTSADTILAVIGYATKGKLNTPTTVTSRTEFVKKFGNPPTTSPYSHLAVYRAFNQTNNIIFYRIGDTTGTSGDTAIQAERIISGEAGDSTRIRILMDNFGSGYNGYFIVVEARDNPVGDTYWDIKLYDGDSGLLETFSEVSWNNGDTNFFETKINADPDNDGSEYISVSTYQESGDSVIQISAGSYYIGQADGGDTEAWEMGDTWTNTTPGDSTYYDYRAGDDGIPSSGDTSLFTTALSTSGDLANIELYNYHILITPDSSDSAVEDAAITLAEYRKDFIYIADPPYGKTYSQVKDWHNGNGQGRATALNSSYAATYWPWLKEYNTVSGEYVWCPPSVFIAEKYLEVDKNYGPWYAVAGDNRGKITAYDTETSPSFAQREVLYGDLNAVNPIVNFASKGLEVFGQKTLLRANSALNRVNVRRMVIYVKKLIKTAMDQIVFEPHNADSWARATNLINSILEPVRQANGLDDYRVTIDDTTNTADLIAQNIMAGVIQLVPVGTIEIINLSIKIYSPGATIV